jgi:hypothetical protein
MTSAEFLYIFKYISFVWSIADFLIVFFFIRLTNVLRKKESLKEYSFAYYLLYFTFVLNLFLMASRNYLHFFIIEAITVNIHYLTIMVLYYKNMERINKALTGADR